MGDFLDVLAKDALQTLDEGYYNIEKTSSLSKISLKGAIENEKRNAVIAEIKTASPSMGTIRTGLDPIKIAKAMEHSGAVGISVLTEPRNFGGDLNFIQAIKESVRIPILMKDIILDLRQVKAASFLRADAILLIKATA
jgi:indole-3-glycerol phosphate synthase